MSIVQAVLLGILGGFGIWDSRVFGLWMIERPLILGPLVGIILRDLQTGIIVGASLELVMMGVVGIGSATPPDTVSGSILATAFAITSGLDISAAVALALPIATLGQLVGIVDRTANAFFVSKADKAAERGDFSGVDRALWGGAPCFCKLFCTRICRGITRICRYRNICRNDSGKCHKWFISCKRYAPGSGIILMRLLFNTKNAAFFFVEWVLTSLIGVNTVGAAVIGTTIAYIIFQYTKNEKTALAAAEGDGGCEMSDDLGGEL